MGAAGAGSWLLVERDVETSQAASRPPRLWEKWIDYSAAILVDDLEMALCAECPCFFKSKSGVVIELHMDDFHGTGPAEACAEVIE